MGRAISLIDRISVVFIDRFSVAARARRSLRPRRSATGEAQASGIARPLAMLILRRAVLGILILFVVTILVFAATQALPGSAAVAKLGRNATPEAVRAFNARYNLDAPLINQYFSWLGHLLRGDFGVSLISGRPVTETIGPPIVNSLILLLLAAVLAIPLSITTGVVSAMRRDSWFDHSSSTVLLVLAALPEFVLGVGLLLLLATTVTKLLPAASLIDPQQSIFSQLKFVVLPAITLALVSLPYIARMMRASMIEVLESDYVAMARLNGLRERRVIWRHATVNAGGPTVQAVGLTLAYLAGGDIIVETLFQYPGVGLELYQAIVNRNLPEIQILALLIAAVYILINIASDVMTILITPRLRTRLR